MDNWGVRGVNGNNSGWGNWGRNGDRSWGRGWGSTNIDTPIITAKAMPRAIGIADSRAPTDAGSSSTLRSW